MKPRGIELSIGRPIFNFFAALKIFLLSVLIVLFVNVTITLYTKVSTRYYAYPHPPFLKITSSSTFSFSSSYSSSSSSFSSTSSSSSSSSSSSYDSYSISPRPPPPPPASSTKLSLESDSVTYHHQSPTPPILINSSSSSSWSTPSPPPLTIDLSSSNSKPLALNRPPISSPPPLQITPSIPVPSPLIPSPPPLKNSTFINQAKGKRKGLVKRCDFSKGEWIPDPNAPYYTNSTCRTIQEHQNCMKYGRPDLDFLKWRWKPDGCDLPLLEPAEFLEFMRGKNLAFIGDSLARNQMQSLMCLLSRVEHPEENWPPVENVTQMFYKTHNFTIWAFWSPFLVRAEETQMLHKNNNHDVWNLYLDEHDSLWQLHLAKFDAVVLNTGNWFNRPARFHLNRKLVGCQYCPAESAAPSMSRHRAHRSAFRTALGGIVGNRQGYRGVTVVRTVSPSHFEGGEWNSGGDCRRTAPLGRGGARLAGADVGLYRDQMREFWKAKWEGSEKGMEFRLVDTAAAMAARPDGHPGRYGHWPGERWALYNDCVHWCLPGPVDMWNDLLFQVLRV